MSIKPKLTNLPEIDIQQEEKRGVFKALSTVIIILILVSMLGWGIVESIFGQQVGFVAKIGKKLVSEREFNEELDNLESQFKRIGLTPPSKEYLYKAVMEDIQMNKMIEQEAEQMGIKPDNISLIDYILYQAKEQDIKLTRDRIEELNAEYPRIFNNLLKSNTRKLFLSSIETALQTNRYISEKEIEKLINSKTEERLYITFKIQKDVINNNIEPSREDLMKLYKRKGDEFTIPSNKEVLFFNVEEIPRRKLSDKEILEYYNKNSRLEDGQKSLRDVQLITFDSIESAKKASFMLNNGSSIDEVKKSIPDISLESLKNIKKSDLQTSISEKIFKAPIKKASEIIKMDKKFAVSFTTKISNKNNNILQLKMEDIRKTVESEIECKEKTRTKESIMELISAGKSFQDVASNFNIKLNKKIISSQDAQNNNIYFNKKTLEEISNNSKGYIGIENTSTRCNSLFFFIKNENKESKVPFSEARNKLMLLWKKDNINKAKYDLYNRFTSSITDEKGILKENINLNSLKRIAKAYEIKILDQKNILRAELKRELKNNNKELNSIIENIFRANVGTVVGPSEDSDNNLLFAVLLKVNYNANLEQKKDILNEIKTDLIEEYNRQYSNAYANSLKQKYKVKFYNNYAKYFVDIP